MTFKARISPFAHNYLKVRSTDLLTDWCIVYRLGDPVLDEVTNVYQRQGVAVKIWEGACRLWESAASLGIQLNDEIAQVTTQYMSFPWDMDPIPEMEDVVKIVTSQDPDIEGRSFTLGAPARGGNLRSTRRFVVKGETSTKEEW